MTDLEELLTDLQDNGDNKPQHEREARVVLHGLLKRAAKAIIEKAKADTDTTGAHALDQMAWRVMNWRLVAERLEVEKRAMATDLVEARAEVRRLETQLHALKKGE